MSKQKQRKTRLKGTATKKPCVDCGKLKDRFKSFKPRWAGCVTHRSPNGRRLYQKGCAECDKLVNGNIRQPRCIDCDKARPKKRKRKAAATPTPTVQAAATETVTQPVNVDPNPTIPPAPAEDFAQAEPEPVEAEPVEAEPVASEPEPEVGQGETAVEAQPEASPESLKQPEPEAPAPAPKPKKGLSKDALGALFDAALGGDE